MTARWIMYAQHNIPGVRPSDLTEQRSLESAKRELADYAEAVQYDDVLAVLYHWAPERWAEALEFKDVGCPFDYPDRLIERGPRGGFVIVRT